MSERAPEPMTHAQHQELTPSSPSSRARNGRKRSRRSRPRAGFGDLSENFEYHAAKNEQGLLERRITILRRRVENAIVVEQAADGVVGVGSVVEIEDEGGEQLEVVISSVGGVSPESPLGGALFGAKVGDVVKVDAPRGAWKAKVVSIRHG